MRIPKILTPEEKQYRKYLKDKELLKVIKCRKCGKVHEIVHRYELWKCSCGKNLIFGVSVNYKNCEVLFDREKLEEELK